MKPPVRIREDRATPAELAADIQTYTRMTVGYDRVAGWAALQKAMGEGSAPPAASDSDGLSRLPAAAARAVRTKLFAAGAIVTAAVAGWAAIYVAVTPASKNQPRALAPMPPQGQVTSGAAIPDSSPQAPRVPHPPAPTPQPSTEAPAAASAPATAASVEGPSSKERGVTSEDTRAQREIAQLARVRSLLELDPRGAYRLAESGHRQFSAGSLYHEREALAIVALWSIDPERAQERTRAFLARFPRSPFRARIEALQAAVKVKP